MVTSWNWIYLADFASYKPVYIPKVTLLWYWTHIAGQSRGFFLLFRHQRPQIVLLGTREISRRDASTRRTTHSRDGHLLCWVRWIVIILMYVVVLLQNCFLKAHLYSTMHNYLLISKENMTLNPSWIGYQILTFRYANNTLICWVLLGTSKTHDTKGSKQEILCWKVHTRMVI